MMLGAIVVYGIVLPVANKHAGDWYPPSDELTGSKDVRGPYGYQVFIALAFFLGEPPGRDFGLNMHAHAKQQ